MASSKLGAPMVMLGIDNYPVWSIRTKAFLGTKGLWLIVNPDSKLRATGHEMSETELCWTVLSGLPKSLRVISTVLMERSEDLALDTVLPRLMKVEQQYNMEKEEAEVSMFCALAKVRLSNKDRRCFKCGKAGHIRAICPELSSGTRRTVAF